jgi:hypothetical protein
VTQTETKSEAPKRRDLDAELASILVELAVGDRRLPELKLAALREGQWAAFSFSKYSGEVVVDGFRLRLLINASGEAAFGALYEAMGIRNQPATIILKDGTSVVAELAHMRSLADVAEIHLHHWEWRTGDQPAFWIGSLKGRIPQLGNLALIAKRGRESRIRDAFRLEGAFHWYLLATDNEHRHLVVVDGRERLPRRDELMKDMFCMEFAFGTSLQLDHLVGVTSVGTAVGAMSLGHFVREARGQRVPVPDFLADAAVWVPGLFRLVATKMHAEGLLPLMVAIAPYLDAESDHLDGGYLKAQVGLEAFATRLVGRGTPELLVSDAHGWKKWVKTLRPIIQQYVLDPKKVDTILGKFISAMYVPSGDRVERALAAHGVVAPNDVIEEIAKRNYPAHGFLMNPDLDHDIDRDARRLEMVQTLLAALVACHVGYHGPLRGYDPDAEGHRPSPAWWPVTLTREDAWTRYVGTKELPADGELASSETA